MNGMKITNSSKLKKNDNINKCNPLMLEYLIFPTDVSSNKCSLGHHTSNIYIGTLQCTVNSHHITHHKSLMETGSDKTANSCSCT